MNRQSLQNLDRYQHIVPAWPEFLATLEQALPLTFWVNWLRTGRNFVQDYLWQQGISSTPLPWFEYGLKITQATKICGSFLHLAGLIHIQEEVAMLPITLLAPRPGESILDLCAAPGNKTMLAALMMDNRGCIVANDASDERLRLIRRSADRLGVMNVALTRYDAARFPLETPWFDKVIADVPCSCEATSRKNPNVLNYKKVGFHERLPQLQLAILQRAFELCKPGGKILYSTCTYAPEENEGVVDSLLNMHGQSVQVESLLLPEGVRSSPGLCQWDGKQFDTSLSNCVRIWPHQNDSGGFFIAILKKN